MLNSVMVVDDECSIRNAVEQWLSLSGFEVQLFSRAEDCLAALPAHFHGVILSDVRMPGLSGLQLLAEVQKRDADLPVILLTLRRQVLDLAALPVNVLIRGETGSGKELIARCLHDFGPRADKPFVALNCAAIPEQLFEAELFGHESGAFTGASGKRIGKLEYADGGTLFLDEIESMPMAQQVKLLRVLQEQKLERLGSNQSIRVDLRIVAATKPDLLDEARAGRFREDLAYRLNVAELRLPPLRDRREDIPLLFESFVFSAAQRLGRTFAPLSGAQLRYWGWMSRCRASTPASPSPRSRKRLKRSACAQR